MSDYAYVADRAKKAFASVSKLEAMLLREPESRAIQMNLSGMRKMAAQARTDMENLARQNFIEICNYRIVPMFDNGYRLGHVCKSLFEYQNLFSQIHDSFKNGPKQKAVIGEEAATESSLDFAYTYSGSLGVVLLTKNERDFFSGSLDEPIETLFKIMDIGDADSVRDLAMARGRAVVKRIHDWSQAHVDAGFSVDIKWKKSDGRLLGQMIDYSQLKQIADVIVLSADSVNSIADIRGVLVGANKEARSFHIVVPDGDTYKGHFDEAFEVPEKMTVGGFYDAQISVSDSYFYATDAHKKANSLLRLSGPITI